MAKFSFEELAEGQEARAEAIITDNAIDQFAQVSGDVSTLHMNAEFAAGRGFAGRVVHGAYLGGIVSRLIGTQLPGVNALIHQMQLTFHGPTYVGDTVVVSGRIAQKVESVRAIVIALKITGSGPTGADRRLASGKAQVGFTG